MDRSMTCWQCKHLADTKGIDSLHEGSLKRGRDCDRFEYRQWHNSVAEDGTEIKNRQPLDYRTESQWLASGRRLKKGAVGKEMYASRHNMKKKYRYYLIEETVKDVAR